MKSICYDESKWQLVPKEPSIEMLQSMNNATHVLNNLRSTKAYEYALQSAPQPEPCASPQQVDVEPVAWMNSSGSVISDKHKSDLLADAALGGEFACSALTAKRYDIRLFQRPDPEVAKLRAQVVELKSTVTEQDNNLLLLIGTVKYLQGIAERGNGYPIPNNVTVEQFVLSYVKSIESAVLEKLKAQKPFTFHHDEEGLSYSNHYTGTVPLYLHPLPPDDVVRDAERYRWLRDETNEMSEIRVINSTWEHLDAAIDAAMKEMK